MEKLNVTLGNAQHIGSRKEQQDSFAFSDPKWGNAEHAGFVAVVADGMGGMQCGQDASRLATKSFLEAYALKKEAESIPGALKRALFAANDAVAAMAERKACVGEAGTTLVAVVLHREFFYWASVGDSRIYLIRDGAMKQMNREHNFEAKLMALVERGHLEVEDVRDNPQREALTSYIGIDELVEIDLPDAPVLLTAGDRILLCSDGLYKTVADEEILTIAMQAIPPEAIASALVTCALSKNRAHQDNVTAISLAFAGRAPEPKTICPSADRGDKKGIFGILSHFLS